MGKVYDSDTTRDTLHSYMREIADIPLVTKQQEKELSAKILHGEGFVREVARETLITANLRLVVKIAHDFKGMGLPLADLISEGNIGLMRAVEKFDPSKGAKFSSYAAWWIKQAMRRALSNQSKTIRVPIQSANKINKIKEAKIKLTEKLGYEPSNADIARVADISERTIEGLKMSDLKTCSLHEPLQQGEEGEFQDVIPDSKALTADAVISNIESVFRLMELMEKLDPRPRKVLELRFGLRGKRPMTLEEVSQEIGRTRERVRQIQNSALTKLKNMIGDDASELPADVMAQ